MTNKEEVLKEKEMIKECTKLVQEFFGGNIEKTTLWFSTPNPGLGNIIPNQLMMMGRTHKLLQFIKGCLDGNKP